MLGLHQRVNEGLGAPASDWMSVVAAVGDSTAHSEAVAVAVADAVAVAAMIAALAVEVAAAEIAETAVVSAAESGCPFVLGTNNRAAQDSGLMPRCVPQGEQCSYRDRCWPSQSWESAHAIPHDELLMNQADPAA